jgi:class 3 adenylate cyclase
MCVTGLPEPDEQHAVNMSRFAYQSLVQMDDVTRELNDILGQGTEDLQMRIGLHSGRKYAVLEALLNASL